MKKTIAKLQPLVDWVDSYPSEEIMKEELGLTGEGLENGNLRPKSLDEVMAEGLKIVRADEGREELFRRKRLPLTKEEYKERRKRSDQPTHQRKG